MRVWYVGYFDIDNQENRNYILAATNKMRYIMNALSEITAQKNRDYFYFSDKIQTFL